MELLLFLRFYFGRNPQEDLCFFLLTTACRYLNYSHYEFGKMFDARITLSHVFKKNYKHVTEQMTSNNVLAQIFLSLWTLDLVLRAHAALFGYMQFVRVLENITFCSLFTNRLRPFGDFNHHTVTSINHLFLFSSETWDAALSSLSLSVLRACNVFCVFLWQF